MALRASQQVPEPDGEVPGDGALLRLEGVGKQFAGVWVLRDVSLTVGVGEVVMLVGENGAGKSTFKNILCGLLAPDAGRIFFRNQGYDRLSPGEADGLGIGAIHQELSLFPNLSVAENIHAARLPTRRGLVDWGRVRAESHHLLAELLGAAIHPMTRVAQLTLGERQEVEIAKALHRASSLLILDEPTTSLSLPERRRLFEVVRRLRGQGYGLIYITHFLEEVYELGDRIAVLRDGVMVGGGPPESLPQAELERLMVGRELAEADASVQAAGDASAQLAHASSTPVLRVRGLSDGELLNDISFDLHGGEILGLAGLMGAGRTEVAHAVFGLRMATGTVELDGKPFADRSPARASARGLVLVSEDRRSDQAFLGRPVRENLTSAQLGSFGRGPLHALDIVAEARASAEMAHEYGVRAPGLEAPLAALSGGNQQKTILARWLSGGPRVCILDEPTKGIDVGAKAEVHRLVAALASAGVGIVLISSDMPELLALSHRILVLHKGRITGMLARGEFDPLRILRIASTGRDE